MLKETKKYTPQTRQISAEDLNTFGQMARMLNNVTGPSVFVDDNGIHIRDVPRRAESFWARLSASTQDGSNKRWKSDWAEAEKTGPGYGEWTDIAGGRTGGASGVYGYAYNLSENGNSSSGAFDNGTDSGDFVGTFDLQPTPDDAIVWGRLVYPTDGSDPEFWYDRPNGIGGACP